jgi:hypothetical protein
LAAVTAKQTLNQLLVEIGRLRVERGRDPIAATTVLTFSIPR